MKAVKSLMGSLWLFFRNNYKTKTFLLSLIFIHTTFISLTTGQGNIKQITGRIIDVSGKPIPGATVKIKGEYLTTFSDDEGRFKINTSLSEGKLIISSIGFSPTEYNFNPINYKNLALVIKEVKSDLDEVQVIGYGQVLKKFNTGSISTITDKEISKQPITNLLSSLSGRLAGVYVQTTNGLPGGNINIQIRGKGSISAGTNPMYIIDGVPYTNTSLIHNTALSNIMSGEISPLNSLNPSDIESINVLKDADATAIYGSRGANGVILITTKKGVEGKTKTQINFSHGISQVANLPSLLKIQDFLDIRKDAYKNDGLIPSSDPNSLGYAPDLTLWNQNQATDWAKYIMGGLGQSTNFNATLSGGSEQTKMLATIGLRDETSVLRGDNKYLRGNTRLNIQHTSLDHKFNLTSSLSFTLDQNNAVNPQTGFILLPPNFPIYNGDGELNWSIGINPVAALRNYSQTKTDNTILNTTASYNFLNGIKFKTSFGYNQLKMHQLIVAPKSGSNPNYSPVSTTYFGNNQNRTLIIEPQLDYSLKFNKSNLSFLLGGTWQKSDTENEIVKGSNFNSESMLENPGSASTLISTNNYSTYKYASLFTRLTYNYNDKYILNISGRRDGSSRFGPDKQYGNFGALGVAWIISQEPWFKNKLGFLNFAKIRSSYGITGNDQITDYQYLSTYQTSGIVYQNYNGLAPSRIANDQFHWESNKKAEIGLETSLFDSRLNFNITHFENISGNQLINYTLPTLTGFSNYQANLPAKIKNSGWEIELNSKNIQGQNFSWSTNFNLTFLKNRLLSFPDIESSSYSNTLIVDESTQRATGFIFLGTDPSNGTPLYSMKDGSKSSMPDFDTFYSTIGKKDPSFYGGLGNTVTLKGFQLDIFFQLSKQYLVGSISSPGTIFNNFEIVKNRWRNIGDVTDIPKASSNSDFYYAFSSANFFNAAYLRLKNVQIAYSFPNSILKKAKIERLTIYLQGQNLATWWNRKTALYDPESGGDPNIPALKILNLGIQLTL